jgi:hypothetical protein
VDSQARLVGVVVDAMDRAQEREALVAKRGERLADRAGRDLERGLVAEEDGVDNAVGVGLAEVLGDQLVAGRVRPR